LKALIFDLDGVIVSTDRYHYLAWKKLADRLGIEFDEKEADRLRGVSRMASLEIVLEQYHGEPFTSEEKEQFAKEKNRDYREYLMKMTANDVSADVRDSLEELKKRGHKIAIGSSSRNTKLILERVGLLTMFDAISDGTNITKSKPDPEVFLKAAEFLGESPENCIVVEDARSGIDAAHAAGMTAVGIGDAALYDRTDKCITSFREGLLGDPVFLGEESNHKKAM